MNIGALVLVLLGLLLLSVGIQGNYAQVGTALRKAPGKAG
jgi:hypothetical protein